MALIAVVDDDASLRSSFAKILKSEGHETLLAQSAAEGIQAVLAHKPDLVIIDVRMPGMDGITALGKLKEQGVTAPVIVMTAFSDMDTAVEAMGKGAFDYIVKPFDIPDMLALITRALQSGVNGKAMEADAEAGDGAMIGACPAMREIYKAIGRIARTDATVLVTGESGTGKELVASAIHRYSKRAGGPFAVFNCAAVPEALVESELFGFERGAFSGAHARKPGRVEQAAGGSLFLDEIGEMPVLMQAKLLRLLQERTFERLGGALGLTADIRVIAATNVDLARAMGKGRFREDLYYRLKVATIELPPLRERGPEDIRLLAGHFLTLHAAGMGLPSSHISPDGLELLTAYPWPGNVRELGNVVQKALLMSGGGSLSADLLRQCLDVGPRPVAEALAAREAYDVQPGQTAGQTVQAAGQAQALQGAQSGPWEELEAYVTAYLEREGGEGAYNRLTEAFSALVVARALSMTEGNRSRAAKLLGLSRPTLLAKIERGDVRTRMTSRAPSGPAGVPDASGQLP